MGISVEAIKDDDDANEEEKAYECMCKLTAMLELKKVNILPIQTILNSLTKRMLLVTREEKLL